MDLLDWSEELRTGVANIDTKNEELISHLKGLHSKHTTAEPQLVDDLVSHIFYHFATEDTWMNRHNYLWAREHMQQHLYVTREIVDLTRRFRHSCITFAEMLARLQDILFRHILAEDRKYGLLLRP